MQFGLTDLLEVNLPLQPLLAGPAPPALGSTGHGFFFGLLGREAAAIGDALHAPSSERKQQRQPFTVSPLLDGATGMIVQEVAPTEWYWLRITLLAPALVELWQTRLEPRLPAIIELAPGWRRGIAGQFRRGTIALAPQYRTANYADFLSGPLVTRWRIEFLTPTTFQQPLAPAERDFLPRLFSPLPAPDLLVRNLARAWVSWAPPDLTAIAHEDAVVRLARHLQIEEAMLRATSVTGARDGRVGFTGTIMLNYRPGPRRDPAADRDRLRLLHALLSFATFAGVGVQTARGMGIVVCEPLTTA